MKQFLFIGFFFVLGTTNGRAQLNFVLPEGFAAEQLATGLNPVKMAIDHHGNIWVLEKHGQVWVIEDGEWPEDPFITLSVNDWNERGLLGIALHPDFDDHPYVYLYYSVAGLNHNRLSRFTANGNLAVPGSEVILFEFDELEGSIHNGGALLFGQDSMLYVATGDGGRSANGQDTTTLSGKIVRLHPDGSIPASNPFYNEWAGGLRAIYATGIRNPFSMAQNPISGQILFCDVGGGAYEEINELIVGKNYGWKLIEGPLEEQTAPPDYQDPLYAYSHDDGCAIVGAAFYHPEVLSFPELYHDKFFFADYCAEEVRMISPSVGTNAISFITNIDRPLALEVDPETGDLYILTRAGLGGGSQQDNSSTEEGILWRVFFTGSGAPLISSQPVDQLVSVDESTSFQVAAFGSSPLQYQWRRNGLDLPEMTSAQLQINNIPLSLDGSAFRCIVSNDAGADTSSTAILSVTSNQRPAPVIDLPQLATTFRAGDTISFSGFAVDPEEGLLPTTALTWTIDWHHDQHTHPVLSPTSGISEGEIIVPIVNETDPDVWYRIYLQASDTEGLIQSTFTEIFPDLAIIELQGDSLIPINIDGQIRRAPYALESLIGLQRTIEAPEVWQTTDTLYLFSHWSTGDSSRILSFQTPINGLVLGAVYESIPLGQGTGLYGQYFDDPELDLDGTPVMTRVDSVVAYLWGAESPANTIVPNDFFTVRWTGDVQAITAGEYTFSVRSDDGCRLWVNDQLLIDQWVAQPPTEYSGSIPLAAGERYSIQLEYLEIAGGAEVSLFWQNDRFNKQVIPQRQLYPINERASVSGLVWLDENQNDFWDLNEFPIPQVTVLLFQAADTSLVGAQTTDSEGKYRFDFLDDGIYYLQFVSQSSGIGLIPGTSLLSSGETPLFQLDPEENRQIIVSFHPTALTETNHSQAQKDPIVLYPNPSSGLFYLDWSKTAQVCESIRVFDLAGKLHWMADQTHLAGSDQLPMDLSNLSPGIYLVQVQTAMASFQLKAVKK